MVEDHPGEEFKNVKWGMFILKYMKSAFERQIEEAVRIQEGAEPGEILNSKAEYNQSALPRLVTRLGDREKEMKEWEKEKLIEKEKENKLEEKIRQLRKQNNKIRLQTEKNHQPKKKQRTETSYISIRDTWGPIQPAMAPKRNIAKKDIEYKERNRKRRKIEKDGEILTNLRKVEGKSYLGEEIKDFELEEERDWEQVLKNHKEKIEKQTQEKQKRIADAEIKKKSWELYKECKIFLEENERNWEKLRVEREVENKKKERLYVARIKQEQAEAEVVPSSVKLEVIVEVVVKVSS